MYVCSNCSNTSETPTNFCGQCGARMVEQAPEQTPVPPVYQPVPPVYHSAPVPAGPNKGKQIVGMILGIAGFIFAIFDALYALIGLAADGVFGFSFSIAFAVFSLPLSLVGMVMSNKGLDAGCNSAFCRLGKRFGLLGVILTAVGLFFGFIGLLVSVG